MAQQKQSKLTKDLLAMSKDMHRSGIMDDATYDKITMRHLGLKAVEAEAKPLSYRSIRAVRQGLHLSQAVFARYLNVTTGYVSQLERGVKTLRGPGLVLMHVIRNKGLGVLR